MAQNEHKQLEEEVSTTPQRSKESIWLSLQYAREMLQYAQRSETQVGQLKWISDAQRRIDWAKKLLNDSTEEKGEIK